MHAHYAINRRISSTQIIMDLLAIEHTKESMVKKASQNLLANGYLSKGYTVNYTWFERVEDTNLYTFIVLSLLVCISKVEVATESLEVSRQNEESYLFRKYLREGYTTLDARGRAAHEVGFYRAHIKKEE